MALGAILIGVLSVLAGLAMSWHWDTPTGPTIVMATAMFFAVTSLIGAFRPAPGSGKASSSSAPDADPDRP